jgi:hypothetical protein
VTTTTSRKQVRDGIAAWFGGTYQDEGRCWQGGSLLINGLGTVRKAFPKRVNDNDYFNGMVTGRNMGAFMVVEIGFDRESRDGIAGAPVLDSQGNIIAGGIKRDLYRVTLNVFHLSFKQLAEDAQDDVDQLVEAIKQRIRIDRTLGMPGVITQAGESSYGIQTTVAQPGVSGEKTYCYFKVVFDVHTQFVA